MSDMPERIWADHGDTDDLYAVEQQEFEDETEYVRYDIVKQGIMEVLDEKNAEIARLREAGEQLLQAHADAYSDNEMSMEDYYHLVGVWDAANGKRDANP